ncbi:putative phosphoenolpyruvate synthase [Dufourea novaeangliae]|uniref:Putative phosphoenolpyruvate synthase n=1 Tax=Dufourea novaeangliae TaxID=178035 RepID=A0A154P524_DUFNO|nr:putative phosphoenolpyruvate synthase [Dufourea novaeangliae]
MKVTLSILVPLWLYFWLNKTAKRKCSTGSCSKCVIPSKYILLFKRKSINVRLQQCELFLGINFLLKHWWAECCLKMRKKKETKSTKNKNNQLENSRIKDKDSSDSMLFYGADQHGNSLHIKFSYRGFKKVEASLHLTTSDNRLYVLPVYPDTALVSSFNQVWTAAGLKIEPLKSQERWRIVYNGMLRNIAHGDECSDENIEHVRLNFLFIANSKPLKWPEDWSPKLHADALAHEQWKSPEWINKIKQLDHTGADYFGSLLGQIKYNDGAISTVYLRGLHQHRWGQHESQEFNESVTLFGVMLHGALYYLNTSSTKHSFPEIRCGQFRHSSEEIHIMDSMGLELSDFMQKEFTGNSKHRTWFRAEGKDYDISVKCTDSVTVYYGQPWNWLNTIIPVELELNGKPGVGLLQLCHSYNGLYKGKAPPKLQYLKQPYVHVERSDYVVRFDDGKCQNENIVGGKGFSLAVLTSIKDGDFIVPKGFCVTVFALELQLHTHTELQNVIKDIERVSVGKKEGDLQQYCEKAKQIIQSTPVVDEVKGAILKAMNDLESESGSGILNRYAVRSSAVGEDSEETSAAGQNATFLAIQGVDNIIKNVAMCWASLFSYQSVKYRKHHGMFIKASMGVCVQQMVNADTAGVMFTRHPTTTDPSNIVITANYGLGETVVSASVEPDTIIIHKSWNNKLTVKSSTAGNKRQKLLANENGLVTVDLNEQENNEICISETIALRLAAIGMNLETLFSSARDIEWAVIGEKIYLLQARPITTLYTWTEFELMHELDNGVPSDTDILSFANIGEVCPYPISPLSISAFEKAYNDIISATWFFKDRCLFNIVGMRYALNYYNMFLAHPRKHITFLNKVIDVAVSGNVVLTPEIHKIALERNGEPSWSFQMFLMYSMLKDAVQCTAVEKAAKQNYQDLTLNAEDFHTACSLYNEINKRFTHYTKASHFHMHTSRVGVTYQIFAMTILTKGYADLIPDHFSDIAILLGSCSDIISGQIATRFQKIVNYVKKSKVDKEFKELDPTKCIDWLKVNCPPAATEFENILKEHGHRCIQETDFFYEPWCLRPENLITTLQTMVTSPVTSTMKKTLNVEESVALLKTPKSNLSRLILKKLVPLCRTAVVRRELTKALYNDLGASVIDASVKVQGTPVCGGSVLNRACVITDLLETHKIQHGDILITRATDIAWSPYFALFSGIVTEMGGLISHGAVVAREYGLPCIISAKGATQMFQTGDTVLLVADTGVLQLVKKFDQQENTKTSK